MNKMSEQEKHAYMMGTFHGMEQIMREMIKQLPKTCVTVKQLMRGGTNVERILKLWFETVAATSKNSGIAYELGHESKKTQ